MISLDFTGRSAVVTGGTRGIGKAIAQLLLRGGSEVVITGTGPVPSWLNEHDEARFARLDFTEPQAAASFVESIGGGAAIDVLVNNAGVHDPAPIWEAEEDAWDRVQRVNVNGPMQLMRRLCAGMMDRRQGWVLNIASTSGLVSRPRSSVYSASKAALVGLTRAAALDLAPYGVVVNALCPGTTRTDMVEALLSPEAVETLEATIPMGRLGRPEEVAAFAGFLVSSLNTYVTGQAIAIDGGYTTQ